MKIQRLTSNQLLLITAGAESYPGEGPLVTSTRGPNRFPCCRTTKYKRPECS